MLSIVHKVSAALATGLITSFWVATAVSELFLGPVAVVWVKTLIPYGFLILIPALAAAGGTGFKLARGKGGGVVGAKRKRMPFLAANGVLVLIPAALYLAAKAQAGDFDTSFYVLQAVELVAGAVNLTLLGLNIRDGRRLTAGHRRRKSTLAAREMSSL
ncbi:hypothetical protein [Roseibium aggregatum]|uniref:Uncharacterized protein n=1 Tax=Roseibium aggregatum TaxID=187304 RepID=A0A939EB15_9HYPH|nr:hypothetical protein [Roseibium aggregatum]MBN9669648.1 hypothetical protein [Roseibium aggregatum]